MSGCFKGRSIFSPSRGAVPKCALGHGIVCKRAREPLAAEPQSLPRYKAAPLKAVGDGEVCRRAREPLAAELQSLPPYRAAPLQAVGDGDVRRAWALGSVQRPLLFPRC